MTDDQLAARQIVALADAGLVALIKAAEDGDKEQAKELNKHIRAALEFGVVLDDRLVEYVAKRGLPAKGKDTDTSTRDNAIAFAMALRMQRGETWGAAINAVADLASVSEKTVETAFKKDMREAAEAWANDPDRRVVMVAIAAPYLA